VKLEHDGYTIDLNPSSYTIWKEVKGEFVRVHRSYGGFMKVGNDWIRTRFKNEDEAFADAKSYIEKLKSKK
jgi:hypothetical protein